MFGLEEIADAFDRMHAVAQKDWDDFVLKNPGRMAGDLYGPDSPLMWPSAISAGILWALGTFTLSAGKGLVDTLRLGEGVKSGTATGVLKDGLRLLNIVPAVGAATKVLGVGGKAGTLAIGTAAAGGSYEMSCGATASTVALRQSGRAFSMTLEEVGNLNNIGNPKAATFTGMSWNQVRQTVSSFSEVKDLNVAAQDLSAVEAAAQQGRGPIVFAVRWTDAAGQIRPGGHFLTAFKSTSGQVMVADQFGVRAIAQATTFNGRAATYAVDPIALLVSDGVIVKTMGAMQTWGASVTSEQWLASSLAIQFGVLSAKETWQLDTEVRKSVGRPPRTWTNMPEGVTNPFPDLNAGLPAPGPVIELDNVPYDIPAPVPVPQPTALSPSLLQDSQALLQIIPKGTTREYAQLATDSHLPAGKLRNALLQLNRTGLIVVKKWSQIGGQPTPGLVMRALR